MTYAKSIITQTLGCVLALSLSLSVYASADPLQSPMWDYLRNIFIGDAPYQFDDKVVVTVPPFAEDPTQVPLTVDASAYEGDIQKVVVWSDLNPIQHIYTYYPIKGVHSVVSLRIKVQQGTPVRAAVLRRNGEWHIGSAYLDAAGGGCTTPSLGTAQPYWEKHLGEVSAKRFSKPTLDRLKFKIIHPMDTGLVDAIPEFYLQQLELRNEQGEVLVKMELSQPVSENPVFTFDILDQQPKHILWLRDNSGNEFEQPL